MTKALMRSLIGPCWPRRRVVRVGRPKFGDKIKRVGESQSKAKGLVGLRRRRQSRVGAVGWWAGGQMVGLLQVVDGGASQGQSMAIDTGLQGPTPQAPGHYDHAAVAGTITLL